MSYETILDRIETLERKVNTLEAALFGSAPLRRENAPAAYETAHNRNRSFHGLHEGLGGVGVSVR